MITMKMNVFRIKRWFLESQFSFLLLALFFTGLTTSCLDDEPIPEPDPVAYLSLHHVAPITSSLAIILDNNRINSNPFVYTDYSGYSRFYTGERSLKITPYNASNTLLESDITLVEDSIYSVFITGTPDDLELMVINDKISFDDTQNSLIRVLHASPDAPAVNLVFSNATQATFEDVGYRDISFIEEISSGNASFEIRNAETDELISSVSNYDFSPENFYTIVVRGYANPQDGNENELSVQVVRNFYNP